MFGEPPLTIKTQEEELVRREVWSFSQSWDADTRAILHEPHPTWHPHSQRVPMVEEFPFPICPRHVASWRFGDVDHQGTGDLESRLLS